MRMRILHVSPYGEAAWAYGGIPRVVGALSRGLARRGHDVTVCTTDVCDESSRLPNLGRREDSGRPEDPGRPKGRPLPVGRDVGDALQGVPGQGVAKQGVPNID